MFGVVGMENCPFENRNQVEYLNLKLTISKL